jgi:hypothetical protein
VLTDDYGEGYLINPTVASPTATYGFPDTDQVGLPAVTCLSTECVAVSGLGEEIVFDSNFDVSNDVYLDLGAIMESVSCPSSSSCTAVDEVGDEVSYDPANPGGANLYQLESGAALSGIACPATGECVAVDANGEMLEFTPVSPSGVTRRSVDSDPLTEIACPQTTFCVAGDDSGRVAIFNPLNNAAASLISVDSRPIQSISCPTTTQCTAGDNNGTEVTFNPSSSAVPVPESLAAGSYANGVSCISTSVCVMVTNSRKGIAFDPQNGNVIASAVVDPSFALMSISCPSSSLCESVDYSGNVYEGSPTNPAGWTAVHLAGSTAVIAITCAPTSICVAVDQVGNSYLGQGGSWFPAPSAGSAPTISGSAVAGATLTESHASWAYSPTGYSYQWEDCNTQGSSCSAISGATGQTYQLTSSDVGHTVVVLESASNSTGSGQPAQSAPTGVIAAGATVGSAPKATIASASASAFRIGVTIGCSGNGSCSGTVVLKTTSKPRSIGSAGYSLKGGATANITVPLSSAGVALVAKSSGYRMPVLVTLTGSGSATASVEVGYRRFASGAITYQLATAASFSEVASLGVRDLPARSSIHVSCSGSGCPFHAKRLKPRRASDNLSKLFAHSRLHKAVVTVRLSARDFIGKVFVINIRGGGKPATFKDLCAAPGGPTEKCR